MDDSLVVAAQAGDAAAFGRLIEPFRRELQVHCYRMLGSIEDAEDAVQETHLRAWARLDGYAGRGTFRAWLYSIATRACLDLLRRRKVRSWPPDVASPSDPRMHPAPPVDLAWLQPYPDTLLAAPAPPDGQPESMVTAKETIELAFLASIQRLPARQRAVLILRDVLDWSAGDTSAALDMSVVAVNSALQRAHATLADYLPSDRDLWTGHSSESDRQTLSRLIDAWERSDTAALVALLRADARLVMPPRPTWFAGRDAIEVFLREHVFGQMGSHWLLRPTAANRQPAFALYRQQIGALDHRPFALGVLDVSGGRISELAMFTQPELFDRFEMPDLL
ncbi:RNA polymerase subunit sigma-70 [Modestobacter excelsi]|uniref:RNA polymerase subunit sigma-70 n=1 Tax=Modestobacter excelsi TaxID=2213161 RepID=UPI00110D1840|nr:RNA polymerase subunit sigma-70 [Modestobacter excelsi]